MELGADFDKICRRLDVPNVISKNERSVQELLIFCDYNGELPASSQDHPNHFFAFNDGVLFQQCEAGIRLENGIYQRREIERRAFAMRSFRTCSLGLYTIYPSLSSCQSWGASLQVYASQVDGRSMYYWNSERARLPLSLHQYVLSIPSVCTCYSELAAK